MWWIAVVGCGSSAPSAEEAPGLPVSSVSVPESAVVDAPPAPSPAARSRPSGGRGADAGAPRGEGGSAAFAPMRAGLTDDNEAFGAYLEFLGTWTDRPGMAARYVPTDVRGRARLTVLDAAGDPVPDAELTVEGDGTWTTETHGDGTAWYFPALAGAPRTVTARVAGLERQVAWDGAQDLTLRLDDDLASEPRVPLDVVLVVDTTGSMGDEIDRIKQTLLQVTREVTQLQRPVDLRWGAVLYRDHGDDYVTRQIPLTRDAEAFEGALRQVRAGGGGDTPEDLCAGLADAVGQVQWRDHAAKVAFLVADAEPHLDYGGPDYVRSSLVAASKGIRVHTVAASGLEPVGTLVYRQIAELTGGKFVYVEYGSAAASAARHGVAAPQGSNNLDAILADRIREEVEGWGRSPQRVAAR